MRRCQRQDSVRVHFIESLRLEKAAKIIESNCYPNTAKLTSKPCPQGPHPNGFPKTSRDGDFTSSLGSLFQCFTISAKKHFLIFNLSVAHSHLCSIAGKSTFFLDIPLAPSLASVHLLLGYIVYSPTEDKIICI